MNHTEIYQKHGDLCNRISSGKLYDAMSEIKNSYYAMGKPLDEGISFLDQTYKLMLGYTVSGFKDPNREKIFKQLQASLYCEADKVKKRMMLNSKLFPMLTNQFAKPDFFSDDNIEQWFNFLINNQNLSGEESDSVRSIINNQNIKWYNKALIISALTVSQTICFDVEKLKLTAEIYLLNIPQIWQRALCGLFIIVNLYQDRISVYPETVNIISALKDSNDFTERYQAVMLRFIKSADTERIAKKINDEIMPELNKMAPEIKNKLRNDENNDEQNPDWNDYFAGNENIMSKLEEFSKMQMDGSDVFIGTFAQFKHFPFFGKLSNWFVPFYNNKEAINESTFSDNSNFDFKNFIESLKTAPFICNSDKYSFCLSIGMMPDNERNSIKTYFNSEVKDMQQITMDEKLLNKKEFDYKTITQYMQDLYRFFTLNNNGKKLQQIFKKKFLNKNNPLFEAAFPLPDQKRTAGEFFFKAEFYEQTSEIFDCVDITDADFYQRRGFAAQKSGKFNNALNFYLQSDFLKDNQLWTLKKIAYCYKMIGDDKKSLEYYLKAEQLSGDNLQLINSVAKSLADNNEYEEALKRRFKADYLEANNLKTMRAIAKLSLLTGKYNQTITYSGKIADADKSAEDYTISGHALRLSGKVEEGCKQYFLASQKPDFNFESFINSMFECIGNDKFEIAENNNLIIDYIKYRTNNDENFSNGF